jgi:hypothetical protein
MSWRMNRDHNDSLFSGMTVDPMAATGSDMQPTVFFQ